MSSLDYFESREAAMEAGPTTRPRRRDAAATRTALLNAARSLMARHGVEGTSTRDVAAAAGVNQALVYRYFGSKEKLFAEAAGAGSEPPDIIAKTPLGELPRVLLDRALALGEAEEPGDLSTLVAAVNDEHVRAVLRHRIDTEFATLLAARLDGPDAALRAELVAATLIGVELLRNKIGTNATSGADRETLAFHVERMMRTLVEPSP